MVNITDNLCTKQGNLDLKSVECNQEGVTLMVCVWYVYTDSYILLIQYGFIMVAGLEFYSGCCFSVFFQLFVLFI